MINKSKWNENLEKNSTIKTNLQKESKQEKNKPKIN